jgi:PAS domain S-box-containing protein
MSASEPQVIAAASANRLAEVIEAQRELLARATNPEDTLAYAAELACRITACESAAIFTQDGDWFVRRAVSGKEAAGDARLPAASSLVGLCFRTAEVKLCEDTHTDPRVDREMSRRLGIRSSVVAPLLSSRGVEGVLRAGSPRPAAFSAADVQLMQVVGGMIGAALELAAVIQRAQQQTDEIWSALEEASRSEQTHRLLFDENPTPMFIYDPKTIRIVRANSAALALYGYGAEEFVGLDATRLVPPEDLAKVEAAIQAAAEGTHRGRWRHRRRDGGELLVHVVSRAFELDGRTTRLIIVNDETERRHAEHKLRESEERYQDTVRLAPIGIAHVDPAGRFADVNSQICDLLGYSREELIGTTVKDLSHPEDRDLTLGERARMYAGEIPAFRQSKRYLRKDGETVWVSLTVALKRDVAGTPLYDIAVFEDITERMRAEERLAATQNQLMQADKMASVGQLAAGVAHEINNPIGYVYSNLGTLGKYLEDLLSMLDAYAEAEKTLPADDPALARVRDRRRQLDLEFLREDLTALMKESREGITRVKKIVQDLKDFSHADARDDWQTADLRKGLESTLNIAHNELKYKCTVVKELSELPEIECLPSQLNQVFLNLLVNAAHAIKDKGTVGVRTAMRGEQICVEISDTGCGIPRENLKRIFDPFFTTKPIGKGTGLGLSLSYGIVKKHGGRIEVESEPGRGTTFRVLLPRHRPVPPAAERAR